jgi:hypothetical protein
MPVTCHEFFRIGEGDMEEGREERQGIYNIAISKLLQQFIVNAHALCNKKFYNIDHRSSIEAWVESLNRKSGLYW